MEGFLCCLGGDHNNRKTHTRRHFRYCSASWSDQKSQIRRVQPSNQTHVCLPRTCEMWISLLERTTKHYLAVPANYFSQIRYNPCPVNPKNKRPIKARNPFSTVSAFKTPTEIFNGHHPGAETILYFATVLVKCSVNVYINAYINIFTNIYYIYV